MGYLGFLFEQRNFRKIVFVEKKNIRKDIIVGLKSKMSIDDVKELEFFNKELSFEPFLRFEESRFVYGKISLSDKTVLDYEYMTFWFGAKKYREIRQLLEEEIRDSEDLKNRVLELYDYFK